MKVYNLVPVILNTPIIPWSSCFHIIIIIIIIIFWPYWQKITYHKIKIRYCQSTHQKMPNHINLTHFMPLISFDTPWKHQKTSENLWKFTCMVSSLYMKLINTCACLPRWTYPLRSFTRVRQRAEVNWTSQLQSSGLHISSIVMSRPESILIRQD